MDERKSVSRRRRKKTAALGVGAQNGSKRLETFKQVGRYIKPANGTSWLRVNRTLAEALGLQIGGGR